jgi:basic amino acid/polyamine antiporter, APA family
VSAPEGAIGPERLAGRPDRLPRTLGVWSCAALLVGTVIGSGIFRVPSTVAAQAGHLGAIASLWIAGALVALFGALTIAELAALYPRSGGIYVYVREAWGPLPAFLFGWTRLLVIQPAVLGAIGMIFAAYVGAFTPLSDTAERVIAASVIIVLAAMNYRSVRWGAAVQNASTVAKVAALIGLALAVFIFGDPRGGAFGAEPGASAMAWGGIGAALIAVLWTYDGWADLTYIAGEVRDPARTLPRALIAGTAAVVVVYFAVNAAYLYVLRIDETAASTLVAADAATRVFGTMGASAVAALVMLSTFGAINGALMSGPRVFFALADDGLFFRRIAAVHPKYATPHAAIVLAALLGVGYVSIRTFEELAEAFILGIWPFYILAVGAVFVLRRRYPHAERPYRVWGYPVVPLIFLAASAAMLIDALVRDPVSTLIGFSIILSGVPVYLLWRRRAA